IWTFVRTHIAPDQSVADGFGASVAIEGSRALIGSQGGPYVDDDPGVEGSAYLVDLDGTSPWTDSYAFAFPHLAGIGQAVVGSPILLRVHNSFDSSAPCMIVFGTTTIDAPLFGQT